MDKSEHKQRHIELHGYLDELIADWIDHTKKLPSQNTVTDLMKWSHRQTENPTEKETGNESKEAIDNNDCSS